jgi:hypothetical protein
MTADTEKLRIFWEGVFLKTLNSLPGADFVTLRTSHLVALGLFVFVRPHMTARIRDVEVASIKVWCC